MPLDTLIARWFAIGWLLFGFSHLLYPAKWAALVLPLRSRENGGLMLGTFNLLLGLIVVLGHNVWVWGLPVIVTLAGWLMALKGAMYLLFPGSHVLVMPDGERMERGFRVAVVIAMVLGALLTYDSFYRR